MKQLLCILLVLWVGVQANWAQAHATQEAAHQLTHAFDVTLQDVAQPLAPDLDHDEHCGVAHCCHGAALAQTSHSALPSLAGTQLPAMNAALISRLPPPEIERPKWALATHAVASF